ncbi:MAG: ArgP/LysG family DNA-binding transcriptional regulator [Nocardioides sp.]|jgi:LysR family transcriptional regulator (chromosome initiation inhibitor)|uniref:ArgP/LysG family DNA-binding transcriptional regulator n=1 Tax=Nocardioides sp. TaxID=35761 RepID=UPI002630C9FE|nr:ArgP/LysG family DNA-binding transcriptional regulator [Nocardioides sp.]MCW2832406.1 ArgP/LysG family DNA-binding transcriptional regulator [Nocardioides sp.]
MYDRAQLAALAAVVTGGSFEAAARELHLTPSAVSQRVRALENAAGAVLVQRTRPCAATSAGEHLVRLARQVADLEADTDAELRHHDTRPTLAIAANADSVSTWFVAALRAAGDATGASFDVRVDDENHTAALLRAGAVMGAVTTAGDVVQGCRAVSIGSLRYRAVAAPDLGITDIATLVTAPRAKFHATDDLPDRLVAKATRRALTGQVHTVTAGDGYLAAIRAGLGWGAVPELLAAEHLASGSLVEVAGGRHLDVPLHWQHWRIASTALVALSDAVVTTARTHLVRPRRRS